MHVHAFARAVARALAVGCVPEEVCLPVSVSVPDSQAASWVWRIPKAHYFCAPRCETRKCRKPEAVSPELGQRIRDFPQQAIPLQREMKVFLGKRTPGLPGGGSPRSPGLGTTLMIHCPRLEWPLARTLLVPSLAVLTCTSL